MITKKEKRRRVLERRERLRVKRKELKEKARLEWAAFAEANPTPKLRRVRIVRTRHLLQAAEAGENVQAWNATLKRPYSPETLEQMQRIAHESFQARLDQRKAALE